MMEQSGILFTGKSINMEKLQKDLDEVKERADIVLESLEKRKYGFFR